MHNFNPFLVKIYTDTILGVASVKFNMFRVSLLIKQKFKTPWITISYVKKEVLPSNEKNTLKLKKIKI